MKKLLNLLKKYVVIAIVGLIISNIVIPTPDDFNPDTEVSICASTPKPAEDPLDDVDY